MLTGARVTPLPRAVRFLGARAALSSLQPRPLDWFAIPANGDALGNDVNPTCWEIARRWCITLRRAAVAGDYSRPTLDQVNGDAVALGPAYSPADGTDTSAAMASWATQGLRINDQMLDIVHPTIVDPTNDRDIALGLLLAGPCIALWRLPIAMQDPMNWSRAPGAGTDWTTLWAEHAVCAGATDGAAGLKVRTWGMDLDVHPDTRRRFMIEFDVPLCLAIGEWLGPTGVAPDALDRDALVADVGLLG